MAARRENVAGSTAAKRSGRHIKEPGFVTATELIKRSDIVVIGAPHSDYAALKIPRKKVLVDIWNMFGRGGAI